MPMCLLVYTYSYVMLYFFPSILITSEIDYIANHVSRQIFP